MALSKPNSPEPDPFTSDTARGTKLAALLRKIIENEVQNKTDHVHAGPSDVADDVIACLKDLYATEYAHVRPLPWCEDFNLHLGEVYTNLQLQYRDHRRGRFQDTGTIVSLGDIYNIRPRECEVNFRSAVRKIRVEGDPGIGKSCSCQKLAYDWSCGKLDRFKVVFFLQMRHLVGKVKDEIFEQLLPEDTKMTPDQLWSYIQENQDDVLFILDGLDELSQTDREVTDVVDLIQGKILRNCHVLVTSRPYQCVKDLVNCHQFYKIVGYSKKNSEEFIHKYFCKSPESGLELVKQIRSNSTLSEIVVNPLNNVLICVVWEDNNGKLPSSKDELYEMIVNAVAMVQCTKIYLPMEGVNLPPAMEEALRDLGTLAWEGLEQEQFQFNIEQIQSKYGTTADNMLNMGLLTRDYSFSRIKRICYCSFLHKTIQKYMATHYTNGPVCRRFGVSDGPVVNRELIMHCYHEYRGIQNRLLLTLGEDSRPLFERFVKELNKAQTDKDRNLLSFLCIIWLGTSCAGDKMADIVAPCLPEHATNCGQRGLKVFGYDHANWCVGLAHVLTFQKKPPVVDGACLIQHLTIHCDRIDGAHQEKLGVLENALSDFSAMRSVTLVDTIADTPLRTFIPRCGTELVVIRINNYALSLLSLLSKLEQLSAVSALMKDLLTYLIKSPHLRGESLASRFLCPRLSTIEHVEIAACTVLCDPDERDVDFSEYDRLLALMIAGHSRLRSFKFEIGSWERNDSQARGFGNLTATLQSISEHARLEVVEFELPGKDDLDLDIEDDEFPEVDLVNNGLIPAGMFVQDETFNAEPMVHTLTECVKKNKVLRTLRLRWRISYSKGNMNKIYHGECSNQSLSSLCSAIRENTTLETLVVDGLLSHSECRADMISELLRNKPSNYKKLSITLSDSTSPRV
ncbi:uncharacterized protein LOC118410528 [Branchiostoma floridae]|uniref:Uncharacterized protein LOC118410528 n=1 Tax=Branchiostoma floridae TaxID=7739 RepID=A0A9J7KQC3_BRAFL|nr:uncharacterized protein LOC118410528 [Branchiostoma floridae]